MAKILSIKQIVDDVKKVFVGANTLTVIINASYIKESKAQTYYTSPIGFIIDKRLYTIEQLSKHPFAECLISIKKSWYTVIKCNSNHNIWAICIDCSQLKKYHNFDYYKSTLSFISQSKIINRLMTVKEFDLDVDIDFNDEDVDNLALARDSSSEVDME